jgi:hypothetical protein
MNKELLNYLVDYINEEIDRKHKITLETVLNAIEAFEGGAR